MNKPWYEWDSENETLEEAQDRRLLHMPVLSVVELEALKQLAAATWDGNLISKSARSSLWKRGLVVAFEGWQVISLEGLAVLEILGLLNDQVRVVGPCSKVSK